MMKYDLIFYISKKTSYCEKTLRKALSSIDGEARRVVSATTPVMLGEMVANSLRLCPLTVIIGGFNSYEDDNLATVLSRVFSNSTLTLENMRKLGSDSAEGYIIRYKSQILLALPDSPRDIEQMLTEELLTFISEKTAPSTEEEAEESDTEEPNTEEPDTDETDAEAPDKAEDTDDIPPDSIADADIVQPDSMMNTDAIHPNHPTVTDAVQPDNADIPENSDTTE